MEKRDDVINSVTQDIDEELLKKFIEANSEHFKKTGELLPMRKLTVNLRPVRKALWLVIGIHDIELDLATELPRERILTHKEIRVLVENVQPPLKYAVLLALNTGMRKGEILSLRWENVNLERNFITVTAVEAKSKRIRRFSCSRESIPPLPMVYSLISRLRSWRTGSPGFPLAGW